ncbi:MAG TPA: hemerythrin domain-containing protein [Thermodesulfobacteriota bacterium]|nr:hemerythrin domain-containing protein [Thermodesulfobacteriota bacterium]
MEYTNFLDAFKEEHKIILNNLLSLKDAVKRKDTGDAEKLVRFLDDIMGPHFRVEEEALYPMLTEYFGEDNVERLLEEHTMATDAMNDFKNNIGSEQYMREHGEDTLKKLQGFFLHVTSCDGLSIIIEKFSDDQKKNLDAHLMKVRDEAVPLTVWKLGA